MLIRRSRVRSAAWAKCSPDAKDYLPSRLSFSVTCSVIARGELAVPRTPRHGGARPRRGSADYGFGDDIKLVRQIPPDKRDSAYRWLA
jgi:hypothetical protein